LGHTTRSIAVAKRLAERGHDISFGAYGYSKQFIEDAGFPVHEIPSEIKLVGKSGSFDIVASIRETVKGGHTSSLKDTVKLVRNENPDVVVSDSYFTGVIVAKLARKRVHMLLNQNNIGTFFENRGFSVAFLGGMIERFQNEVFKHPETIIIPDYPPPYTITKKNITLSAGILDKLFYAGPLVRKTYASVRAAKVPKPHILSMVGGFGYRRKLFDVIRQAAGKMRDINFTLVAGPSVDPASIPKARNIKVVGVLSDPFPHIKASSLVIAPGGHSTMMECLSFGKPVLSFLDLLHSEQQGNAEVLEELSCGRHMSYFSPTDVVVEAVREVLEDGRFAKACARMRRLSEALDGPTRVCELIEGGSGA